jgi:membrane associated rhomboid family serine protease
MESIVNLQSAVRLSPVATFIFLATIATSLVAFSNEHLKQKFMLRPYSFVEKKKYYTILTSGLIHANFLHLAMNLLAFYFFAFFLDNMFVRLEAAKHLGSEPTATQDTINMVLGHGKFLILYVGCMFIADITTIIKYKNIPSYASLGASGAISGVVLASIIIGPAMGREISIWGIPGWLFALLYIGVSYFSAQRNNDNIGHEAHLWGALGAVFLTPILYPQASWTFVKSTADTFSGLLG